MTEQGDHEAKADELERSLDEMQERSGRLEGDIEGAGEDWERKQHDPAVPGAVGDQEGGEPGGDGEELDFGRDVDYEGPGGSDAPAAGEDESGDAPAGESRD